ncbi:MAG: D-aminoacyl-tRNA deacylase [Defluviitaleaceae bacterium]|nr:D-aminoacyl-tRNA deacylase [Defluviitaleaceae bacterium]
MKIMVQRAKAAKVRVEGKVVGQIERGLMLLIGVTHEDGLEDVTYCAKKVANLRIFEDEMGKMNLSIKEVGGAILSISQFTLYGNTEKGNRPSYSEAARPEVAKPLYDAFNVMLRNHGIHVEEGLFGAMMDVEFTNEGPVTLIVASKK